jgi:hypothetical protein
LIAFIYLPLPVTLCQLHFVSYTLSVTLCQLPLYPVSFTIKDDSDLRQFYIEADQVESGFSDEESLNQVNKSNSKSSKSNSSKSKSSKSKTNSNFDTMILNLYDSSVKELNKTKEQLYKAKNQIDVDEVKMRYLRLDLNKCI